MIDFKSDCNKKEVEYKVETYKELNNDFSEKVLYTIDRDPIVMLNVNDFMCKWCNGSSYCSISYIYGGKREIRFK